jgi:hypothetical protein
MISDISGPPVRMTWQRQGVICLGGRGPHLSVQFFLKYLFSYKPPTPSSPTDPACTPPSSPSYSGKATFPAGELPLPACYRLPPRPRPASSLPTVPSLLLPREDTKPSLPLDACGGVIFSPSSWEPQEEGMMNIAARFFPQLRNQGLSFRRGRSQTTEGDAC